MTRNRGLKTAAVAVATLLLACSCASGSSDRDRGTSTGAERPKKQTVLRYSQGGGSDSIIPGALKLFTIGTAVRNRSKHDVVVESFEIVSQEGVSAKAEMVVGPKRKLGALDSAAGFPPKPDGRWDPDAMQPLNKGFRLPHGKQSAEWGYNVLMRVERIAQYGYMRGYRVRGTIDGKPFVDEVDSYIVFCGDGQTVTSACNKYSTEHNYR
jgi:hypothetical protein